MADILKEAADQVRIDIEFLLSFTPATTPEQVSPGLAPMFYVTGTYEGDVELARKVQEICERYDIVLDYDEDEDFEGVE
jgi:hypothetical protein